MRTASLLLLVLATATIAQERKPVKLTADEQALVDLANRTREKEKLAVLKVNATLCKVAKQHAENMAKQEKMDHVLDGKGVAARVTDAGYDYRVVGENLARADGDPDTPAPPPADIHKHWMESKRHHANLVNPKFREVGLAIARSKKGTYFYAQVFGTALK